jgi:hypothetical protein
MSWKNGWRDLVMIKKKAYFFDPRLTAEALKQRGVDIQTINLI